jgi:hypothetical protein
MPTTSPDGQSPLGPQLCSPPIPLLQSEDDGITLFRGMLVAGTASVIFWGVCIVLVMMLRSRS